MLYTQYPELKGEDNVPDHRTFWLSSASQLAMYLSQVLQQIRRALLIWQQRILATKKILCREACWTAVSELFGVVILIR